MPAAAMLTPEAWSGSLATVTATDTNVDPNVVEVTLRATPAEIEYLPGKRTTAWTYGGTVPGPTIRAKLGDRILVHFRNDLPEPTTIHWHGLRLPNAMDGAGPAATPIPPGGTFDYAFDALDAGTYWYHPHVASNEQVDRGLYGAIVIDDPAEPALPVVADEMVVLDDVMLDAATGVQTAMKDDERALMMGLEGNLALVNGRRSNVGVAVRAGEWRRLRLLSSANARYFKLSLAGGTMIQLATDGTLLEAPAPVSELLLVPGERADVVVRVDSASNTATLRAVPYARAVGSEPTTAIDLVRLVASAEPPVDVKMPAALRPHSPLSPSSKTRTIRLGERTDGARPVFLINDAAFPAVPTIDAKLGSVEEWAIQNESDMDHPFHLHGFFFQPVDTRVRKDTVNVPAKTTVRLLVDFHAHAGAAGSWMYHCHILEHAEGGMLAEVMVNE
ncbi:MAG: multicopper oxidase family protein [Deltaproteobacteria bacterium]|nr:multicopper oxidase family protein [Deltaproteobacteria bacterium]